MALELLGVAPALIEIASQELASLVDETRFHVLNPSLPLGRIDQVLLDIRSVKDADRQTPSAELRGDRAERVLAREVADNGNDSILALHALDHAEILLAGEEVASGSARAGA